MMVLNEAIKQSKKGIATRTSYNKDGMKKVIIGYKDGAGYCLHSDNGKVDFFLSRPAVSSELRGHDDWEPSI